MNLGTLKLLTICYYIILIHIQMKSPLTNERASRIPINTEISSCNNINNANNT